MRQSSYVSQFRRRAAPLVVAFSLACGGLVVAEPAQAQPVVAVAAPQRASASITLAPTGGEVAGQFSFICPTLDRLANRFARFSVVLRVLNALRARFGCISPG